MKFIKTPVKGMCDMLPADMRLREHVLGMIKETYGACGFMQIETPVMEHETFFNKFLRSNPATGNPFIGYM